MQLRGSYDIATLASALQGEFSYQMVTKGKAEKELFKSLDVTFMSLRFSFAYASESSMQLTIFLHGGTKNNATHWINLGSVSLANPDAASD